MLSFGIIAKSLQHEEGCYLPSFDIDLNKGISEHLTETLEYKDLGDVADCVAEYGLGSKETGIRMLTEHIKELSSAKWNSSDHVFKLVITDVLDRGMRKTGNQTFDSYYGAEDSDDENDEIPDSVESIPMSSRRMVLRKNNIFSSQAQKSPSQFRNLINDIEKDLPRFYIHIPDNFNILINSKSVEFNFWQRRMVELMKFHQTFEENESFLDSKEILSPTKSAMNVRIFCGFDVERFHDPTKQSALSLYIYSRRSGRLIKHEPDARNMLRIPAGGTDFAQGLTCIIDDYDGKLPLNPTKQDVAFNEKRNGEIMGQNLYAWTSATVHFYYKFHIDKFLGKRKTDLSQEMSLQYEVVKSQFLTNNKRSKGKSLKLLADADFSTIKGMKWHRKKDVIRCSVTEVCKQVNGKDTAFHIIGTKPSAKKKRAKLAEKANLKRKLGIVDSRPAPKKKSKRSSTTTTATRRPKRNAKKNTFKDGFTVDISTVEDIIDDNGDEEFQLETQPFNALELEQLQVLSQQLERERNINAKQKHDYAVLMESRSKLDNDKQREIDRLKAELQNQQTILSAPIKRDEDYEMMEEVKNNLQDENERLEEEQQSLLDDRNFLSQKVKILETKLEAEKAIRMSLEDEVEMLKKELERNTSAK